MSPELMKRLADFVAENQRIMEQQQSQIAQRQGDIADLCKSIKLRFGVRDPDAGVRDPDVIDVEVVDNSYVELESLEIEGDSVNKTEI